LATSASLSFEHSWREWPFMQMWYKRRDDVMIWFNSVLTELRQVLRPWP
jgi:hypothetical protein